MPALALTPSLNQITSLTGRAPRISLAESLREIAPGALYARRQFTQEQASADLAERQLEQQGRGVSLQDAALDLQARQQASQQRQQTVGNAISGVTTLGTGVVTAKQLGLFGGATLPAAEVAAGQTALGASTSAGLTATGAAAEAVPAATAAPALASSGASGAGLLGGGSLAAAAPYAVGAAAGIGVGYGASKGLSAAGLHGRPNRALSGAIGGAVAGTIVAPGIGTLIGAGVGGLIGGLCILVTACAEHPEEIALAKRYRDRYMTTEARRGYYVLAEPIAARMKQDQCYRNHIRRALVEPLLRYGAYELHETDVKPSEHDKTVTFGFLDLCEELGESIQHYRRENGEWV